MGRISTLGSCDVLGLVLADRRIGKILLCNDITKSNLERHVVIRFHGRFTDADIVRNPLMSGVHASPTILTLSPDPIRQHNPRSKRDLAGQMLLHQYEGWWPISTVKGFLWGKYLALRIRAASEFGVVMMHHSYFVRSASLKQPSS
ncbi:hypothetical protein AKJ16_DCAP13156 [Drosera capensis]